jgi:hypothetical protein
MNAQWALTYDTALLALESVSMPNVIEGGMIKEDAGLVEGSCSNLGLYDFQTSKAFVEVTFKVLGEGETVVNLDVTDLTVSKVDPSTGYSDENEEITVIENGDPVAFGDGVATKTTITVGSIVVPTEPVPTEPVPTEPVPTEPVPTEPVPTEPTPTEPTPVEPTEPETTVPVTPDEKPTVPAEDATDATSATGVTSGGSSTSDTPSNNNNNNNGAVQTGNASMAIVILLVLVSASAVLYFARKRVR